MMKKFSGFSPVLPFYLLTVGVFLIIICRNIFSNGMFLDGLIYSTVARNLSEGAGTFWNPQFTLTCIPDFHEHPPLAFALQSIFFTVLGDNRLVDRIYSLFTVLVEGFLILRIWKVLGFKNGWIALLLWLLTPTVFWTSYNNLLENTLTVFISLSVLCYLKNQENNKTYLLVISGFLLGLGFLTKGFVSLFPWTFPFFLWLFLRKKSSGRMITETAVIFLSTVVPLLLLIMISPVARLSLHKYIDNQVIYSIRNIVTVSSRFNIIFRLLNEIAPLVLLCLIFFFIGRYRKISAPINNDNGKKAIAFIALGLSGVLPVMISMKQSGFYILPVYPFFAIATSILLYPLTDLLLSGINYKSLGFKIFTWTGILVFTAGIFLSILFSGGYSRDEEKLNDTSSVLLYIPDGSIVNIDPQMYEDWSLHGYFQRFKHISLDPAPENKRDYLLIKKEYYSDTLDLSYNLIKTNSVNYLLLKRK
jgi:4-amino-4-deoxy-L-arabinose transferase-like glycosyltransferase